MPTHMPLGSLECFLHGEVPATSSSFPAGATPVSRVVPPQSPVALHDLDLVIRIILGPVVTAHALLDLLEL